MSVLFAVPTALIYSVLDVSLLTKRVYKAVVKFSWRFLRFCLLADKLAPLIQPQDFWTTLVQDEGKNVPNIVCIIACLHETQVK